VCVREKELTDKEDDVTDKEDDDAFLERERERERERSQTGNEEGDAFLSGRRLIRSSASDPSSRHSSAAALPGHMNTR
jgi:hypothetical protein